MATTRPQVRDTNRAKYETRNRLAQGAIRRFYDRLGRFVADARPASVLDAGCGEGEDIARLRPLLPERVEGFDIDPKSIEQAARRFPDLKFAVEDITRSARPGAGHDLVMALEVLEHLPDPHAGLRELCRLTSREIIISVPDEPWFRVCNFVGGAFVSTWGNPPDHCQHWNRVTFRRFLEQETEVLELASPFPWLIARCVPRNGHRA
ncbi:class I SAM-dependent methyltransferase [candidate division WOR-3 bacterium]|nr:class I SAM-dependent methyltransferase [candidate division WOR-3 bacterium]